jgi:hypothetical protein
MFVNTWSRMAMAALRFRADGYATAALIDTPLHNFVYAQPAHARIERMPKKPVHCILQCHFRPIGKLEPDQALASKNKKSREHGCYNGPDEEMPKGDTE